MHDTRQFDLPIYLSAACVCTWKWQMTGDMQANRFMGQALIHARMSNSLYFTIIIIIIKFHLVVVFPLCCYCLELQQSYIGRVFYTVPSHTHFFPLHIFYGDHLCTIILLIS